MTTRTDLIARLREWALPDPHDEREVMNAPLLRRAADALEALEQQVAALTDELNNIKKEAEMNQKWAFLEWRQRAEDAERQVAALMSAVKDAEVVCDSYAAENQRLSDEKDALTKERDDREGLVCDQCIDGSGWCENAVEGRYPCTCMTEAEPYQLLQDQLAAAQAREAKLRDAAKAVLEVGMGSDFEALNAALASPTDDSALQEKAEEALEIEKVSHIATGHALGAKCQTLYLLLLQAQEALEIIERTTSCNYAGVPEALAAIKQWKEKE